MPIFRDEDAKVLEASVSLSWETLMMALWLLGLAAMSLSFGLRSLGGVTASLESLDIEIIDDGRKSGSSPL